VAAAAVAISTLNDDDAIEGHADGAPALPDAGITEAVAESRATTQCSAKPVGNLFLPAPEPDQVWKVGWSPGFGYIGILPMKSQPIR
jgi:hypothetical protein